MFIDPKATRGTDAARRQYLAVMQHALETCPDARAGTKEMIEALTTNRAAPVELVFMTNAGPESRLVAEAVAHLTTGTHYPSHASKHDVTLARETWPTLSRTNAGPRGVALFNQADRLDATIITAWLREHLKTDQGPATIFFDIAGPTAASLQLIDAVRGFARSQGARLGVRVLDFARRDSDDD